MSNQLCLSIYNTLMPLIYLICTYILNIVIKLMWHTICIKKGKRLLSQLKLCNDRDALHQLYPQIKEYCSHVGLPLYLNPYGIPDNLVNLNAKEVIQQIIDSLNKAIGVHKVRRGYCYILFTISKNDRSRTAAKLVIDIFIKITVAAAAWFIKTITS